MPAAYTSMGRSKVGTSGAQSWCRSSIRWVWPWWSCTKFSMGRGRGAGGGGEHSVFFFFLQLFSLCIAVRDFLLLLLLLFSTNHCTSSSSNLFSLVLLGSPLFSVSCNSNRNSTYNTFTSQGRFPKNTYLEFLCRLNYPLAHPVVLSSIQT